MCVCVCVLIVTQQIHVLRSKSQSWSQSSLSVSRWLSANVRLNEVISKKNRSWCAIRYVETTYFTFCNSVVVRQRRDSAHNVNGSLESLWTLVSVRFNSLGR